MNAHDSEEPGPVPAAMSHDRSFLPLPERSSA
jgi:hypothetical protein